MPNPFRYARGICFHAQRMLVWHLLVVRWNLWWELTVNFTLTIGPLISLIAGILILIIPRLLNFIVALYLIIIGLIGLVGGSQWRII